jgi:hypothetical protein
MSASEDREARLPEAAEALLTAWPEPERDADFWQEAEKRVAARLESVEAGSAPSDLLDAPLPASDEDGSLEVEPRASQPPERRSAPPRASQPPERRSAPPASLAELARQAVAQARDEADSKDIARESLSLASRARLSAPDLAASLAAARISRPPESTRASKPEVVAAPVPATAHRGTFIGAGIAVVALAAVLVLVVRAHDTASDASIVAGPSAPSAAQKSPTAPAPPAAASEVQALSPDQLPQHAPAAASTARAAPAHAGSTAVAERSKARAATAEHANAASSNEQEPEAKMQPASGAPGLPDHPSLGAVQAAVGAVLGSARACVAGDDQPSQAVLVFASDGHVQSVSVSGPAAGTPAAGCIRAALSRARVEPFGRSSYSVGTPVRPQ